MFNKYILILVWIGFMGLIQGSFYREEYNEITGEYDWRAQPLFAFIVFAPIIWMAANRGWFADSYNYAQSFLSAPSSFGDIPAYLATISKDKGYYLFVVVIKQIIGDRYVVYFLVIALLQGIIVLKLFRRYSVNYALSVFLFLASTEYVSWMFNGIRQYTAAVIIFAATPLMQKRQNLKLLLIILFASTFHRSALIMIPIVIICQGKAWNRKTIILLVATVLFVLFLSRFLGLADSLLESTQYKGYLNMADNYADDGANPIRALVYAVPTIIAFVYRERIEKESDGNIDFFINISIVTTAIYGLSVFTSGILMARLTGFTSIYNYILIPYEMNYCFKDRGRIVCGIMIILYLLFYYYQMGIGFGLI